MRKLKDRKLKGVTIKRTKRGIVLRFGDILFDYKSFHLKTDARKKLARIAGVLKKYGKYDIRVEGHTDNVGDQKYNLKLSRRRGRLCGAVFHQKDEAAGKSALLDRVREKRPVAPNDTARGRRKNRRVEIIILTEE